MGSVFIVLVVVLVLVLARIIRSHRAIHVFVFSRLRCLATPRPFVGEFAVVGRVSDPAFGAYVLPRGDGGCNFSPFVLRDVKDKND